MCDASSTHVALTCPSMCGHRLATVKERGSSRTRTLCLPTRENLWSSRSSPVSRTTGVRPRSPWWAFPDKPGEAALIFEALADAEVNIDMIVQNVSAAATGLTDISFTMPHTDTGSAVVALDQVREAAGFTELIVDDQIGKVSLIGAGMRTNAGISATFFRALSDAGVNVEMISTSEIRISVITRAKDLDAAVSAIHTAFGLDVAEGRPSCTEGRVDEQAHTCRRWCHRSGRHGHARHPELT